MIKSCKKPPVYFESTTGSFYSQYAGLPLKSCRVDLPVNQSGSGTPSPTNIRDFIPYTSLDFTANSVMRTFTFGQNVYIGYLDILTGNLVATHKGVDMGNINYTKFDVAEGTLFRTNIPDANTSYNVDNVVCSTYSYSTKESRRNYTFSIPDSLHNIDFINNNYSSASDFKTGMTGQTLVYELATPITIPLGGMEINTILGLNSLSSSVGNISAEYLKAGR